MRELYIHETADLQSNPKPSNPDNGFIRIYKRDGALKILDSTGSESSIELGVNTSHTWKSGIEYAVGDVVFSVDHAWKCISDHTSTIFSDDIAHWELLTRGYSLIRTTTPGIKGQPVYEPSPGFYILASANDISTTASGIISHVFNASNFIICSINSKEKIITTWSSLGISGGNLSPGTIYYLSDTAPGKIVTLSDSLLIQQPLYKAIDSATAEIIFQQAFSDSTGMRPGQIIETNEKIILSPDKPFIDLSEDQLINDTNFPLLAPVLNDIESDETIEIEDVTPESFDIIGSSDKGIHLGEFNSKNVVWNNRIHNLTKESNVTESSFRVVSYASANDTIICIGENGNMLYSLDDGDSWSYFNDFDNMSIVSCVHKIGSSSFLVMGRAKINNNIAVSYYQNNMTLMFTKDTGIPGNILSPITSIASSLSASVIVAVGPEKTIIYTTDGGNTWEQGTSEISSGITLNKVIYVSALSMFIAIGSSGTIITSSDGITWTTRTSGSANNLVDIVYNPVPSTAPLAICGWSGTIITSLDGITWNVRTSGTTNHLYAINTTMMYGMSNGRIAVGASGTIITSASGITWDLRTSGTTNTFRDILPPIAGYGYGLLATNYEISMSGDGITWVSNENFYDEISGGANFNKIVVNSTNTKIFLIGKNYLIYRSLVSDPYRRFDSITTENNAIYGLTHDGTDFIAVGSAGKISIINNDYNIINVDSGVKQKLNSIVYNNGKYIAVGSFGTILLSYDKITWKRIQLPVNATNTIENLNLNKIRFLNNMFIAVGDDGLVITSIDGITWKKFSAGTTSNLYDITFRSSTALYVVVGSGGVIRTSPNLVTWTTRTSGTTNTIRAICYNGTIFVYGADGAVVRSSTDAVTWTLRTSNAIETVYDIIWNGSLFYLVSLASVVTSSNGTAWNQPIHSQPYNMKCIFSSGTKIIIGGNQQLISYSEDSGSTWNIRNDIANREITAFAESSDEKTIVAVGHNGCVQTSTDGGKSFSYIFEEKYPLIPSTFIDMIYDGTKYIALSYNDATTFYSYDLKKWFYGSTVATFPLKSIAYNGFVYVAVGSGAPGPGGVITSTNGITWTLRTAAAPNNFNSVEWNGSLFIAVGDSGAIKTSPDGITWTPRTSGITERLNKVKYGDGLTIAAGVTSSPMTVLYSTDGITWNSYNAGAGTNEIIDIEYGNRMFLLLFKQSTGVLTLSDNFAGSLSAIWLSSGPSQAFYKTTYDGEKFLIFSSDGPYTLIDIPDSLSPVKVKPADQLNQNFTKVNSSIVSADRKIIFSTPGVLCSMNDIEDFNNIEVIQTFSTKINDVIFANNMFVIIGDSGLIIRSVDGITWKMVPHYVNDNAYESNLYKITYTDKFIATRDDGLITSQDGIVWTDFYSYSNIIANCKKFIEYRNNSVFVFDQYGNFNRFNNNDMSIAHYTNIGREVSFKNIVYLPSFATSAALIDVGVTGQKLIVVSTLSSHIYFLPKIISSPGITAYGTANIEKIKSVNSALFCFTDNDGYGPYYISNIDNYLNANHSSIGKWEEASFFAGQSVVDVEYIGSNYVTINKFGDVIVWSGLLNNLTLTSTTNIGYTCKFISGNVIVTEDGRFFHTPDSGITWNQVRNNSEIILKIINVSNLYYAITLNKTIVSSDGGLTWNEFSDSYNRIDISAFGTTAAIVCENKYIIRTTDSGSTWNPILLPIGHEFTSICFIFDGNYYAYAASDNTSTHVVNYASSSDATTWSVLTQSPVKPLVVNNTVNAFNKIFLLCDEGNILISDTDGSLSGLTLWQWQSLYSAVNNRTSLLDHKLSVFGSYGEMFSISASFGGWSIQNVNSSASNLNTYMRSIKKLRSERILIKLKKNADNIQTTETLFNGRQYYGVIAIIGMLNIQDGMYQIIGFNRYDMTLVCKLIQGLTLPLTTTHYPLIDYDNNSGIRYIINKKTNTDKKTKYYMYAKKYIP